MVCRYSERGITALATAITKLSQATRTAGARYRPVRIGENDVRSIYCAILLTALMGGSAYADESVSGQWHADLGRRVTIDMTVAPDGSWSSQTLQSKKVVRSMKGTYTQTPSENGAGTMVFTPTQATVKTGTVKPETDRYEIATDGKTLKLTSDGDTMVFQKQN
jgi:hypothetical protein